VHSTVHSRSFIAGSCTAPLVATQVDKVVLVAPVCLLFDADGPGSQPSDLELQSLLSVGQSTCTGLHQGYLITLCGLETPVHCRVAIHVACATDRMSPAPHQLFFIFNSRTKTVSTTTQLCRSTSPTFRN